MSIGNECVARYERLGAVYIGANWPSYPLESSMVGQIDNPDVSLREAITGNCGPCIELIDFPRVSMGNVTSCQLA